MSVHKSLATGGKLARPRSVMTRYERILELRKTGKWEEDRSPYGLPKVRVMKAKKRGKEKKAEDEEAES
jgi:small basic protein (TIGR04137 family)